MLGLKVAVAGMPERRPCARRVQVAVGGDECHHPVGHQQRRADDRGAQGAAGTEAGRQAATDGAGHPR